MERYGQSDYEPALEDLDLPHPMKCLGHQSDRSPILPAAGVPLQAAPKGQVE